MRAALALVASKGKSVRSPSATESLFSCVAKRKVTKREGHPAWRLPPILGGKSVSRGRAFRQGILPWRKGIGIHADARCAACRPRLTAAQGPRVEQRAILARTRYATAARWRKSQTPKPARRVRGSVGWENNSAHRVQVPGGSGKKLERPGTKLGGPSK